MPTRDKVALNGGLEETPWGGPSRADDARLATDGGKKAMLRLESARAGSRATNCEMLLEEEYVRDEAVYRAYSFGEPIDSCHFSAHAPVGRARLWRASPASRRARRWAVNYYNRIDYIVITTIWRRERGGPCRCSRQPASLSLSPTFSSLLSRSPLSVLSSGRRSVEASAFPPLPPRVRAHRRDEREGGLAVTQRASQNSCCTFDGQGVNVNVDPGNPSRACLALQWQRTWDARSRLVEDTAGSNRRAFEGAYTIVMLGVAEKRRRARSGRTDRVFLCVFFSLLFIVRLPPFFSPSGHPFVYAPKPD